MSAFDTIFSTFSGASPELGSLALAGAIYAIGGRLDKDLSDRAKADIANFLKTPHFLQQWKDIAAFIHNAFTSFFGEKCLKSRFILRSILLTTIFTILAFTYVVSLSTIPFTAIIYILIFSGFGFAILKLLVISYVVDYLSLVKGKYLLSVLKTRRAFYSVLLFVTIDILLSLLLINLGLLCFTLYNDYGHANIITMERDSIVTQFSALFGLFDRASPTFAIIPIAIASSMMTSIWVFSVFLSATTLKMLVAVDYSNSFTRWAFDVDKKPLQALAATMAALIFIGAIVWSHV